jgi:hypothetical protein
MGTHTQTSTDWEIDFINEGYFDSHLEQLRDAETAYRKEA